MILFGNITEIIRTFEHNIFELARCRLISSISRSKLAFNPYEKYTQNNI